MKIKLLAYLLLLCFYSCILPAQNIKRPDSYNYKRGVEALQNNSFDEAIEYLNNEIKENPDNGYALIWIASIRNKLEEYGRALSAADLAIEKIPKKDKEYKAFAYSVRADIYSELDENEKALKDRSSAIEQQPDNKNLYEKRANLYYYEGKYILADKDYHKIVSLDKGSAMGYMGLGRNANAQKQYEDAIKQFDYVIKLYPDYSSGYSFRAQSYIELKDYNKAADDIVKALDIDGDNKAFHLMQQIADSAFTLMIAKLKIQAVKNPVNDYWPYCLGIVYESKREYQSAIKFYKESLAKDESPVTVYRISVCYDASGDYTNALNYITQAIELDSINYHYILKKADIMDNAGKTDEAITILDIIISKEPNYYSYYRRGWIKDHNGDVDGAIDDYTTSIILEPEYAYSYINRGRLLDEKGEKDAAKKDYRMVITLDTVPDNNSCAQYAYYYLGEKEKAIGFLNKMIEQDTDKGTYYDATCLYSIMGDTDKAIEYFRLSLENGFRRFAHIQRDRDLNNIRELPEFKQLIEKYKQKSEEEFSENKEVLNEYKEETVEIPFISESGVYKVKCDINELPLHFIFDTGASDVSMSTVEATFMLKNNYLSSQDIIGKQNYMTANGEITEGTVINLKNVTFGELMLNNVKASIVKSQKAPLLLGQSVLSRLGTIEIDNQKKVLKITYKKKL
jgi:clan AA aspartic protease (TIGR02281 family)